jgi:hypothetical protein
MVVSLTPAAVAESYGVSALVGKIAPDVAAKVSGGTDAVARKLNAATVSGRMNAEVDRLLDDPRRPVARPPSAPASAQVLALDAIATAPAAPAAQAAQPALPAQPAVRFPRPWQVRPDVPQIQVNTAPPAPAPPKDELNETLQKVRAALSDSGAPRPSGEANGATPLANEIQQAEERVAKITKSPLGAQLPASGLGAGTPLPSDFEAKEVGELLKGVAVPKSDLSDYLGGRGTKPSAPVRLLDSLSPGGKTEDGDAKNVWKSRKRPKKTSEAELSWKNVMASGSTRDLHTRIAKQQAKGSRAPGFRSRTGFLPVARLASLGGAELGSGHSSSSRHLESRGKTIRIIGDTDDN